MSWRVRLGPAVKALRDGEMEACGVVKREDGMWDRFSVTLATVLKPLLRSMSGIVRVSCPCAAAPGQHWRVQHTCIKPSSLSPLLGDFQSDLMSWKRVSRGARSRSHVYSGLLHCVKSSVCLSAISFFHKSVFAAGSVVCCCWTGLRSVCTVVLCWHISGALD